VSVWERAALGPRGAVEATGASTGGRETARVARKLRQVERLRFGPDDPRTVVSQMDRLAAAHDGWINLVPWTAGEEEPETSLGFFTLLGGDRANVTMCTWIPAKDEGRAQGMEHLGITHGAGSRARAELSSQGIALGASWFVEQDHPRRGLVVRIPAGEPHAELLGWTLRAVAALSGPVPPPRWIAEVHLPTSS